MKNNKQSDIQTKIASIKVSLSDLEKDIASEIAEQFKNGSQEEVNILKEKIQLLEEEMKNLLLDQIHNMQKVKEKNYLETPFSLKTPNRFIRSLNKSRV